MFWLPAPVFIMGVVATVAGALAVFFPETLGQRLPETMEEAFRYIPPFLFFKQLYESIQF